MIIHVKKWSDLKGYIIPSVVTFIIGLFLLYMKWTFWGIVFLQVGPCMLITEILEIRKSIREDKKRGHYCPDCNHLLRYRKAADINSNGAWNGWDYYCCQCLDRKMPDDMNTEEGHGESEAKDDL